MSKWIPVASWQDVPKGVVGVYAITDKGFLMYVGSGVVRLRLYKHLCHSYGRFGKHPTAKYQVCTDGVAARVLERRLVQRLRPTENGVINISTKVRGPGYQYGPNPYDTPRRP